MARVSTAKGEGDGSAAIGPPSHSHRCRVRGGIIALLLALFFHVLFLYAFRVKGPLPRETAPAAEDPPVVFLSPASQSEPWERELRAWCDMADPTIFSLPHEVLGFSSVREGPRVLPVQDPPAYEFDAALLTERELEALVLAEKAPPMERRIAETWPRPAPEAPAPAPSGALAPGLIWRRPDGTRLGDVPDLDAEAVFDALSREKPEGPTRVLLVYEGGRPRVHVRAPSGNRALDLLLVRTVSRLLADVHRSAEYGRGNGAAPYEWLPGPGERAEIEVEWRLVPEPEEG